MSEAIPQLKEIVGFGRQITDQLTPGSVVSLTLFDFVETQDGFGFTGGEGVGLLYGDVAGMSVDSWSLQCTAAIAFDVPHRPEIGMWVNEQNRQAVLGKFYYAVTPDGAMSAVMWETHAWSRILNDFNGMQGQGAIQWIARDLTKVDHL